MPQVITYTIQNDAAARRARLTRRARRAGIAAALIGLAVAPTPVRQLSPWADDTSPAVTSVDRVADTPNTLP